MLAAKVTIRCVLTSQRNETTSMKVKHQLNNESHTFSGGQTRGSGGGNYFGIDFHPIKSSPETFSVLAGFLCVFGRRIKTFIAEDTRNSLILQLFR